VYWPIMLKAIGVEPPKSLLVHGWWHIGGAKMSKSSGVTVEPLALIDDYGPDALRYYLVREMSVGQDSDFALESFQTRYQGDLSSNFGNLVSRLLNMAGRNCAEGLPAAAIDEAPEQTLRGAWATARDEILDAYEDFQFHRAMELLFGFSGAMNRYLETRQPWKLAKSAEERDQALFGTAMATVAEGVRLTAALLKPVMPGIADQVTELLGQPMVETWKGNLDWDRRLAGVVLGPKTILFPRPEAKE
ncbi:MAG: class I tRNA ligase family protein, partial [Opitutales bacterium]